MLVPAKNAKLLFQIFFPLFDFARDSLHITSLPTETIRNDAGLIAWILEQFWEYPEYLERFKQERPGLLRRKREIIDGFSRLRAGEFLVLAHTPRGSILADEHNEIYLVKGLGSEITELTLHKTPPGAVSHGASALAGRYCHAGNGCSSIGSARFRVGQKGSTGLCKGPGRKEHSHSALIFLHFRKSLRP